MNTITAIILGIVQGLTEFLPVSSSGHLSIIENLMGVDESQVLFFAAMLHVGTLATVIVCYWRSVAALFKELFLTINDACHGRGLRINANPTRRLGYMILVSAIPTGLIGYFFNDFFDILYVKVAAIGVGLLITGSMLLFADKKGHGHKDVYEMRFGDAFIIGLCQSVAIAPGISRSGATLVGGLFCQLDRKLAVKFAFLMSIPPICGSALFEMKSAVSQGLADVSILALVLGVAAAFFAGRFAIKWMIKLVTNEKLIGFSIYTWGLGALIIILSLANVI